MRKGYALILVLLFTTITLIVLASICMAIVSSTKLSNQSAAFTEAYSLAESGISSGWAKYMDNAEHYESTMSAPTDATDPKEYTQSAQKVGTSDIYFIYSIVDTPNEAIEATGYAGGRKISLEAKINDHYNDANCDGYGTTKTHACDTITIYQTYL